MPSLLTLRPTTSADLASVDALLTRSYPALLAADYAPSVRVLAIPLISRARPELLSSGTYWLAEDGDGRVLGAGGWTPGPPVARDAGSEGETGHIRHFVTNAAHLRQGIGRALMDRVLAQAGGRGVRRLDCLATRTAVPFYTALGFQELGAVDVALRPGIVFPAMRMLRAL
jgi:GNAT superfamily N-acetyltransferase